VENFIITAFNVYSSKIWVSFKGWTNGRTYFTSIKSAGTRWNVKVHVEDKRQSVVAGVEARKKRLEEFAN
jgi:hypothetical protein